MPQACLRETSVLQFHEKCRNKRGVTPIAPAVPQFSGTRPAARQASLPIRARFPPARDSETCRRRAAASSTRCLFPAALSLFSVLPFRLWRRLARLQTESANRIAMWNAPLPRHSSVFLIGCSVSKDCQAAESRRDSPRRDCALQNPRTRNPPPPFSSYRPLFPRAYFAPPPQSPARAQRSPPLLNFATVHASSETFAAKWTSHLPFAAADATALR